MKKILVIDDDEIIIILLANLLKKSGYEVITATDGESGLNLAKTQNPDIIITDYKMPGITGLDIVRELSQSDPGLPVIVLTAHGDVSLTIKSIQTGAYDFIVKPIHPKELLEVVRNGIQASAQSRSLSESISFPVRKAIEDNLLAGKTSKMREIFKNIGRISLSKMNVLITGEPGTGKEQVARLIHYSGITREHPMVIVNCSAIHEEQLAHEIFGIPKGTENVKKARTGKLEQAGEGTILFDDFHALPMNIQVKLLRVLKDLEFNRQGEEEPIPVKARIIAASDKDLEALVGDGKLIKELYYNLKVFTIVLPPLRERLDDIPELLNQMIPRLNRKLSKNIVKVEDGLYDLLKNYSWPGNIRELENVLTQAIILSRGDVLEKDHIHRDVLETATAEKETPNHVTLAEVEKKHIHHVLNSVNWAKLEASKILDITRPTLNAKIEKYKLAKP